MDFAERHAPEYKRLAEKEIDALFRPGGKLAPDLVPAELSEVMQYAMTGGKRLRALLCLLSCAAAGGAPESALKCALAVEALHSYTLIHDDLPCMDNDAFRRGKPTVHAKFGYAQAILAGDALQAAAFDLAAESRMAPENLVRVVRELAHAAGPAGVVGGQWIDVTSVPPHDPDRIRYVHARKTGDLMVCAAVMGALAGNASEQVVQLLRTYASCLGLAFQIVDDLLDASNPAKNGEMSILMVTNRKTAESKAKKLSAMAVNAVRKIQTHSSLAENAVGTLALLAEKQPDRVV